jgi:hypothetical protein
MPRIAINGASFSQRVTGVQRYAREMSARMLLDPEVQLLLAAPDSTIGQDGAAVKVLPAGRLGPWAWVNTTLPRALGPEEVLWSPTIRAPLRAAHHVPTVHDLSVLDHPEWFHRSVVLQWRLLLPQLCRSSVRVVTDSEFSKDGSSSGSVSSTNTCTSCLAASIPASARPSPQTSNASESGTSCHRASS